MELSLIQMKFFRVTFFFNVLNTSSEIAMGGFGESILCLAEFNGMRTLGNLGTGDLDENRNLKQKCQKKPDFCCFPH